jgi:hypothetical protein
MLKDVRESVELDEVSDKMLDRYRQKAFADQPSGDDGSDKYRKRKFGRDLAFAKQTGRAKVLATKEEVDLDELKRSTLASYVKKAAGVGDRNSLPNAMRDQMTAANIGDKEWYKDSQRKANKRGTGIQRAADRLAKEEVELDEASTKIEIPKSRYSTIANMHDASGPSHGKVTRSPKGTMQYKGARHSQFDKKTDTHIEQTYSHGDHSLATIEKHTHKPSGKVKYYMYKKSANEEVELDEAKNENQYIEVTNKFTGSKSHHEVHPSKAFAALNHHNSLWGTKSARIVSGKEAEKVKADLAARAKKRSTKVVESKDVAK